MTRREAAKQLVEIWAKAVRLGFYDDQEGTAAEVVALAVGALLKEGDNEWVASVSMIDGHIDEVLKPCQFCGSKNVIAEINNLDKEFIIFCENDCCRAEMRLPFADTMVGNGEFISFYEMQKIMDDLTDAWNRRADA